MEIGEETERPGMRFESKEVILSVYCVVVSSSKFQALFSMFSMIIIESTITCDIGLSSSPHPGRKVG